MPQQDIDYLFVELEIVKGVREVIKKFDEIAGLARLESNHPLIERIILHIIPLLDRLQKNISAKKKEITDKEKQQVLSSQKISLQSCIEALSQEPADIDAAREAANAILDVAPANAKKK